jgi:predicted Zn-dependent protease with MMP-like domain
MTAMTSAEDILLIAHETVANFPAPFRAAAQTVLIRVEDFVPLIWLDDDDDPWDITGLYTGVPLTFKHPDDIPEGPDTVWLFRKPILDELSDRDVSLHELVAHVTVHEFAHHFGWSDDDIATIDRWWE